MGNWDCSCGYCDKSLVVLQDDNQPFLRQFINSTSGKVIIIDTELDGKTLYTPVGTVTNVGCGGTSPATAANVSALLQESSTIGATLSGISEASIANTGSAPGTVLGVTIPPGATVTWKAYTDPVSNEFKSLGSISYNATGTTFLISQTLDYAFSSLFLTFDGATPLAWTGSDYVEQCVRVDSDGTKLAGITEVTAYMAVNYPLHSLNLADGTWIGPVSGPLYVTQGHFITTWETGSSDVDMTFPLAVADEVDITIDWGDGSGLTSIFKAAGAGAPASATHTYPSTSTTYTIKVCGSLPSFQLDVTSDRDRLRSVEAWGSVEMVKANFRDTAANVVVNDVNFPDTLIDLSHMFRDNPIATPNTTLWNVSNVVDMSHMFEDAVSANPDVSNWDVSSVQYMNQMFADTVAADPDVSSWDTSSVTTMGYMFSNALGSTPDVSGFDTSNVTEMNNMFNNAVAANPDVSSWNVANVTDMTDMFSLSNLSTANYDAALIQFNATTAQNNVTLGASGVNYTIATSGAARTNLTSVRLWTITDAGGI